MLLNLKDAARATCGGKAHTLGTLLRAGLGVPDGVVVPFEIYRAAITDRSGATEALRDEIVCFLETFGDAPMAVRSSANSEDTSGASAAGQHDSVLGVRGIGPIMSAVQACWASLHSQRAVSYRSALGGNSPASSERGAMAVIVQRLVDADISGVMFTPDAPGAVTEIEAAWGLGATVVGGIVTPDSYRVDAHGKVTTTVADKQIRMDRYEATLITSGVTAPARDIATLGDRAAVRLARLGREIASILGGPQDIEWAIADDEIAILQARPITATLPLHRSTRAATVTDSPLILTGTPGSSGRMTGPARIIYGPNDFSRVRSGDILVCPYTDPSWTPLLRIAKGVVTETGGVLSHAAIVARELRIPAVLGVTGAMDRLRDSTTITVDGPTGTITITET